MLNRRGITVLLALALLAVAFAKSARADESKLPPNVTCEDVKARVAEYGKVAAYAWARLQGYTKAQIKEAEKCLK